MLRQYASYLSIILTFGLFFCGLYDLKATHNRAGEITVEQIDALTIKAMITTYTKASSIQADRDSLTLCWGDGNCELLVRINGPIGNSGIPNGERLPNDTKVNIYMAFHVYPGIGTYKLSMTDPNRNGQILNVNPPNSDMVEFHLETTYSCPPCHCSAIINLPNPSLCKNVHKKFSFFANGLAHLYGYG